MNLSQYQKGHGRRKPPGGMLPQVPPELVGAWLFHQGGLTTCKDLSRFGNDLTSGGTIALLGGPFGGQCFKLNGNDSAFTIADNANLKPASFTIVGWFNSRIAQSKYLISKSNATTTGWYLRYDTDHITFGLNGGSTVITGNASVGVWHQVAGTYDANTKIAAIYIDGIQQATTSGLTLTVANKQLQIGECTSDITITQSFDGQIDHFLFLNAALPSPALFLLYQQPFSLFSTTPRLRTIATPFVPGAKKAPPYRKKPRVIRRFKTKRWFIPPDIPLKPPDFKAWKKRRKYRYAYRRRVRYPFIPATPLQGSNTSKLRRRKRPRFDRPRGIRRRANWTFDKFTPLGGCPQYSVLEALQATLVVKERLRATEVISERLNATNALTKERLTAVASTQERLKATAGVIACAGHS